MISVHRVLDELQRQLTKANSTSDEATIRQSLAAMQSLCGLVLEDDRSAESKPLAPRSSEVVQATAPSPIASGQGNSTLEGKLLEESDANGGSLFDF